MGNLGDITSFGTRLYNKKKSINDVKNQETKKQSTINPYENLVDDMNLKNAVEKDKKTGGINKPNQIGLNTSSNQKPTLGSNGLSLSYDNPEPTGGGIDYEADEKMLTDLLKGDQEEIIDPTDTGLTDGVSDTGGIDTTGTGTDGITGATGFEDLNKDGILTADELSGDYKMNYDRLNPAEQREFLMTGQRAMKDNQNVADALANYMRDINTAKTRAEEDEDYRLKLEGISEEAANIQESQAMRRAQDSVAKLKQSIAYLGNMGMPGTSAQRAVSLENQMTEATKSLSDLARLQSLAKQSRALGETKNAQQYERQMEDLTNKLNDNVDKSIQSAYNTMVDADNNGKLDTTEELEAFRNKLYFDLDRNITGFTDSSMAQISYLAKEIDGAIQDQRKYEANNNLIDTDTSAVKRYYVNKNGTPIYDVNGAQIKTPAQIPEGYEPFMNNGRFYSPKLDKDGNLILDENGMPTFGSTGLEDATSVTADTAAQFARMVSDQTISLEKAIEINPGLASNEAFLKAVQGAADSEGNWKEDSEGRLYNSKTGQYLSDGGQVTQYSPESIINFSTTRRGRKELQCGELVNDYIYQVTGTNPTGKGRMLDSLDSKIDAINTIGYSKTPVVGGLFVSNPGANDIGHTGIIQSINADGSIEVLEANVEGKKTGQEPTINTYDVEDMGNAIFSQGIQGEAQIPEISKDTQGWLDAFNNKTLDIDKILTKIGSSKAGQETKNELMNAIAAQGGDSWGDEDDIAVQNVTKLMETVQTLVDDEHDDLNDITGKLQSNIASIFSSEKDDYLAGIDHLISGQTLQALIDAKSAGATFGALSNTELAMLQASSSILSGAAIRDEDDDRLIGIRLSENAARKEIETILDILKMKKEKMTGINPNKIENIEMDNTDQDFFNNL